MKDSPVLLEQPPRRSCVPPVYEAPQTGFSTSLESPLVIMQSLTRTAIRCRPESDSHERPYPLMSPATVGHQHDHRKRENRWFLL